MSELYDPSQERIAEVFKLGQATLLSYGLHTQSLGLAYAMPEVVNGIPVHENNTAPHYHFDTPASELFNAAIADAQTFGLPDKDDYKVEFSFFPVHHTGTPEPFDATDWIEGDSLHMSFEPPSATWPECEAAIRFDVETGLYEAHVDWQNSKQPDFNERGYHMNDELVSAFEGLLRALPSLKNTAQ